MTFCLILRLEKVFESLDIDNIVVGVDMIVHLMMMDWKISVDVNPCSYKYVEVASLPFIISFAPTSFNYLRLWLCL